MMESIFILWKKVCLVLDMRIDEPGTWTKGDHSISASNNLRGTDTIFSLLHILLDIQK